MKSIKLGIYNGISETQNAEKYIFLKQFGFHHEQFLNWDYTINSVIPY